MTSTDPAGDRTDHDEQARRIVDRILARSGSGAPRDDEDPGADERATRREADWLASRAGTALLDDEATVKTFKRKDGQVWLMPHNERYSPIDGTHARIMGKVVAVMRKL